MWIGGDGFAGSPNALATRRGRNSDSRLRPWRSGCIGLPALRLDREHLRSRAEEAVSSFLGQFIYHRKILLRETCMVSGGTCGDIGLIREKDSTESILHFGHSLFSRYIHTH